MATDNQPATEVSRWTDSPRSDHMDPSNKIPLHHSPGLFHVHPIMINRTSRPRLRLLPAIDAFDRWWFWVHWLVVLAIAHSIAFADTSVKLGTVSQIRGPQDLDLDGEFAYAINFSANDPSRTVRGVTFLPDRLAIPGATFVGPQQVSPWQSKPEFGSTADANALEEIYQDIRWASSGGGERLRATLGVQRGQEYKLQVLISGNGDENRRWDIRVNGQDAVDEITSLGSAPGQSYSRSKATLYTLQFNALTDSVVVEMGDLFGANDGGDRNPIWQGLTLERVSVPPTPEDIALEPSRFFPGQKLAIGSFSVTDRRFASTHILSLVPGDGSTDNARFSLSGADLMPAPFDFSNQPIGTQYSIRIRAVDVLDSNRFLEKRFQLTLSAAQAPTAVRLDATSLSRASIVGSLIGNLRAEDPDGFDRHEFTLVPGQGSEENAWFRIEADQLKLAASIPQAQTQARLRVRTTDRSGLSAESSFVLPLVDPKVRINEILASEVGGVTDENQQPQEWIELTNQLDQPLDLTGWYLTDDRDSLQKWRFPSGTIPARGFLLVLADGTGAVVPGSPLLHANFSLSAAGEWLGLVHPDGRTIAHELTTPEQYPGVAFGSGSNGKLGHLPIPTPRAPNGELADAGVNRVTFNRPHGFYKNPFTLELSASVAGSTIRYTTDGSRPTSTTGIVYEGPIEVRPNTTALTRGVRIVRAIAVHPKAAFAPVGTQTYLFVDGVTGGSVDGVVGQSRLTTSITRHATYGPLLGDAFRALPVVSVILNRALTTTETLASVELLDPNDAEPGFQIDCGIGASGTTSLGSPKLAMAAKFRPEYGFSKLRYPVFARGSMAPGKGAEDFKELRLRGHSHDTFFWLGTAENPPVPYGNPAVTRSGDAQLARNPWIDEMQLLMGQPGKRGRQVHMFLEGAYHGIYHIHEHADDDFMASYYPGGSDEYHFSGAAITGSDHGGGDSWRETWASVKSSLGNYEQAKRWIDVTNLCDYMLLSFYAGNDWDWSAQHNWSAAGPKFPDRGGWKFFQQDSDITLQDVNADCTDQDVPDGIFSRLMAYPDFKALFRDRAVLHCYGQGMLTPAKAGGLYEARMNEIYTAIVAETARWQPGSTVGRLPWDRDQEWTNEWRYLKTIFFPQRHTKLIEQLKKHAGWWPADPPNVSPAGGTLPVGTPIALSSRTGKVYFTLDGSDPRLPGGKINPAARTLTNEVITTTTNLIVTGSVWRFLDTGVTPDSGWRTIGFNDTGWRSGPTRIGYGDGDEATVAGFVDTDPVTEGIQRNITTYFRRTFDAPNPGTFSQLRLRIQRDDGAVVYVNGKEVWRSNMPTGVILPETKARTNVGAAEEASWFELDVTTDGLNLQPADNVVAVEIHQFDANNADMGFNGEVIGTRVTSNTNPLAISQPTVLRARVYTGSDWSGLIESYFVPEGTPLASAENLVVSEIHFNPFDDADSEFLELLNTSPVSIDLSGVRFVTGVTFEFPDGVQLAAGERVVVAKNLASFDARYSQPNSPYYQNSVRRFGPWTGSLSNGGEELKIQSSNGELICAFSFGTTQLWPGRADGRGSSLEIVQESTVPRTALEKSAWLADPRQWRSSSEFHGSPGRSGLGPDNRILINEVLAAPIAGDSDGIELLSRMDSPIDISGWYLSDSSDEYRKYQIPAGSTLQPLGRWVLRAADFDNPANPASLIPFGLSDSGDDVYLLEARADGALIRFVDHVEFGPGRIGQSMGHSPDGTGPFVMLRRVTWGSPNAEPEPGYEVWAAAVFPSGTDLALRALNADYDGDGVLNYAEYVFATSPLKAEDSPLVILEGDPAEGPTVIYRVRSAAPDLTYRLEITEDSVTWRDASDAVETLSRVPQPDGATLVTVRMRPGVGEGAVSRWVRVRVN